LSALAKIPNREPVINQLSIFIIVNLVSVVTIVLVISVDLVNCERMFEMVGACLSVII